MHSLDVADHLWVNGCVCVCSVSTEKQTTTIGCADGIKVYFIGHRDSSSEEAHRQTTTLTTTARSERRNRREKIRLKTVRTWYCHFFFRCTHSLSRLCRHRILVNSPQQKTYQQNAQARDGRHKRRQRIKEKKNRKDWPKRSRERKNMRLKAPQSDERTIQKMLNILMIVAITSISMEFIANLKLKCFTNANIACLRGRM